MDREISSVVSLSASVVLLAAFLSIVFFTVCLGMQLQNESFLCVDNLRHSMSDNFLDDLIGRENIMPAVTAYNIIKIYGSAIEEVECRLTDVVIINPIDDFSYFVSGLKGSVKLQVEKDKVSGNYRIVVHKIDCEGYDTYNMVWKNNWCNC